MVGLLPRRARSIAFLIASLCPRFRTARAWAEELLEDTVATVAEDMKEDSQGDEDCPNKSISQCLVRQLAEHDAVGEIYGFSYVSTLNDLGKADRGMDGEEQTRPPSP